MAGPDQVHWHEGLFLQPHHLQLMQRQLLDRIVSERTLARPFPYGVIEWELSEDALQNCRVQFNRLRVITRSGREVCFPGNAVLAPLDIKQAFERGEGAMTVSLAVPHWQERRANCPPPGSVGGGDWLYRNNESEVFDENTGENPKSVQVRNINARLVLDTGENSDMEMLPLFRIKRATGEAVGRPRRDPDFISPTLVLSGSPDLQRIVQAIADQLLASRRDLIPIMTHDGFNLEQLRAPQFGQLLRLRTFSHYAARLPWLASAPAVSPFEVYLELCGLLGELASLQPTEPELFETPRYNHDDPALTFVDLAARIRRLLVPATKRPIYKVDFVPDAEAVPAAALSDDYLTRPNEYYLAVATGGDPAALARLVEHPDNFKLMARSKVRLLVRGVRLVEERHAPAEFPHATGLFYFRLDRSTDRERAWNDIKDEKNIGIKMPRNVFQDAKFTLYMTVPDAR